MKTKTSRVVTGPARKSGHRQTDSGRSARKVRSAKRALPRYEEPLVLSYALDLKSTHLPAYMGNQ